jgi:DNA-binding transcriptional MerR regulator
MDIAEVSKLTGMPASTLRYYEEKGLIASTGRDGLRRRFGPRVLDRLAVIALGRAAGFKLDEIAAMFTREGGLAIDRTALACRPSAAACATLPFARRPATSSARHSSAT